MGWGQPFLLQLAERAITAFVRSLEAGFVAGEECEGIGFIGERAKGKRKIGGGVGLGTLFDFGLLADVEVR